MACLLLAIVATAALAPSRLPAQASSVETRWERRIDGPRTNQPILAELFPDGALHVVTSDLDGRVVAYHGKTGKPIWSTRLGGQLTEPVAGFFGLDGGCDIAVAGRDDGHKTLTILDGATGDVVAAYPLDDVVHHAPSAFPLPPPAAATAAAPPVRHGLALVDKGGRPYVLRLNDAGDALVPFIRFDGALANRLIGVATGPPAVGEVLGPDSWAIVFAYTTGIAILPRDAPEKMIWLPRQDFFADTTGNAGRRALARGDTAEIASPVIVANVKQNARGDGRDLDEVVFFLRIGDQAHVALFEYLGPSPAEADALSPRDFKNAWEDTYQNRVIAAPPLDPMVVNLDSGRRHAELVVGDARNVYAFIGGSGGRLSRDAARTRFLTSPVPLFAPDATSAILIMAETPDGSELRAKSAGNLSGDAVALGSFRFAPLRQPVVGDLDGDPAHHEVVLVTNSNRLACVTVRLVGTTPAVALSWQGSGGTMYRGGGMSQRPGGAADRSGFGATYLGMLDRQRDWLRARIDERLDATRAALAAGDLPAARAAIDVAHGLDPRRPEAASLHRSVFFRESFLPLVAGGLLLIAVVGFLVYVVVRQAIRLTGLRAARTLAAAGDSRGAITRYHRLFASFPADPKVLEGLASTVVGARDWRSDHVDPLLAWYSSHEADERLLEGVARCLMARNDVSAQAFAIYRKAEAILPEESRLRYLMGLVFKQQGDARLAQEHLRHAIKLPSPPPEAYDELADLILAQGNVGAKAVDVLEVAFRRRPENPDLLRGLALAMIDAKRHDAAAQAIYEKMLVHDPAFTPAIVMLCQAKIQAGQIDDAVRHAHRVQQLDPDNRDGIMLLSQCYLIQGRTDDTAVRTFTRASEMFPGDKDIVSTLARTWIAQKRLDEEAVATYRRAFELNQNDADIAGALASVAAAQRDTRLTIQTVEKLIELGVAKPRHYQLLADAYLATDCTDEKAERVFREALRHDAENRRYLAQLARVCRAGDRVDPEALKIYELAYTQAPSFEIGRQLVKAFFHNDLWERIPPLAQKLLLQTPEDPELQKIFAQASLQSNRMDEAIAQYEAVLKSNPDDRDALVSLAVAHAQKGATDEKSFRLYRQAIEIQPRSDVLWMMLGRVYLEQEHEGEAASAYRKAVGISDKSPERVIRELQLVFSKGYEAPKLRWLLAELLLAQNRLREACEQLVAIFESDPSQIDQIIAGYTRILEKDPRNATALVQRGVLLKTRGRFEEAARDLRAAFEANPQNPDAQRELVELYQAVLREHPADVATRHHLGEVYVAMEEYDKAIACFQRSATDYRYENEALKALGLCFVRKDILDLALQEFKKLPIDDEMKEILYDLARRYEAKRDLIGAKTVYKQLFAADIDFRDVRQKYEQLAGSTSDPLVFEATMMQTGLSPEAAKRYELIEELGRGAMGIVYRAKDKELDEEVALKILPESISNNPEAVKRFRLEARNARRLAHPNIIRIHDIGEEMGRKYISMEFVDGTDLKQKFRTEGPPAFDTLVRWIRDIGHALDYAHRQGIVHRDIKPANIMITHDGTVKVADFGIAKALDVADATMTGAVMGTPLYMSPEQVRGSQIDHRADIYSFGIMLYEFATGRPPFTEGDLAYQHLNVEPRPVGGNVAPEMETLIMKCLQKERDDRWATCGELVEYLDGFTRPRR